MILLSRSWSAQVGDGADLGCVSTASAVEPAFIGVRDADGLDLAVLARDEDRHGRSKNSEPELAKNGATSIGQCPTIMAGSEAGEWLLKTSRDPSPLPRHLGATPHRLDEHAQSAADLARPDDDGPGDVTVACRSR